MNDEPEVFPPPVLLPPVVNPATGIPGEERTKEGDAAPPALALPPWSGIEAGNWSGPGPGPPEGTGMVRPGEEPGNGNGNGDGNGLEPVTHHARRVRKRNKTASE